MLSDEDLKEILEVHERGYDISRFKDEVYNNFVIPKWKAEAVPFIGIEWELQGVLLTEECKGRNLYFYVRSGYEDNFKLFETPTTIGYDACGLGLSVENYWFLQDEFYLYRVYDDGGNLEISSKPVLLNKLNEMLRGVNKFLYSYFDKLVKKGLYPFALFLPATDMIEYQPVFKHVNVNFVNKKFVLRNPVSYSWKYSKYSEKRFEIKVPYNFRSYKEIILDLEPVVLDLFYEFLSFDPKRKIEYFLRCYLYHDLDIVSYIWDKFSKSFSKTDYFVYNIVAKYVKEMTEPELLLYSKTGERLVMPGKLY